MKNELLQEEKFQEIYTNEKLRRDVTFAHKCCDKFNNFLYYSTCYCSVTPEQKAKAFEELERSRKEKINNLKAGQLLFVGMGMPYKERYEGDLCNHRIRTYFKNNEGILFFVEFGTGRENEMRCDYSINVTLQKELNDSPKKQGLFYNFGNLENGGLGIYSKNNILSIINHTFKCSYKSVEVDNYTLNCEDFICFC